MAKKAAIKKPAARAQATYKIATGDKAPAFNLEATSGRTLSLKDFKGKALVIYFYPRDNTPGCTLEGQDFKRLHKKFAAANCEVIGVSKDTVAAHEKFREKCGFPFDLVSDVGGELCAAFDVMQMKSLYGRSFLGIERSTFVIDGKGVIRQEWRKLKVPGHADAVLKFVQDEIN